MKKYEITEESLQEALFIGKSSDTSCVRWDELSLFLKRLLVPVEDKGKPKPKFGPGTRLRAANGDELLVCSSHDDILLIVVNLTKNRIWKLEGASNFWSIDFSGTEALKNRLFDSGATIIED